MASPLLTLCSNQNQAPDADFDDSVFLDPMLGQSSGSTAWPKEQPQRDFHLQTMQAEILAGRASSVSHHYGQITPPNDNSPIEFVDGSRQLSLPGAGEAPPLSATSERARNAANQRHAKAKKARKGSARSRKTDSSIDEDGEEVGGKREKYREKNRVAASKCRAKKKTRTENLEESARQLTATNSRLRAEERELRDIFSSLRHIALSHDSSQGCNCLAIHMYNNQRANEAARTAAMGLLGMSMPMQNFSSPSTGSDMSTLNSPRHGSQSESRAPSFSASGPVHTDPRSSVLSMAGQVGFFAPGTAPETRKQSHLAPGVDILTAAEESTIDAKVEDDEHTMNVC